MLSHDDLLAQFLFILISLACCKNSDGINFVCFKGGSRMVVVFVSKAVASEKMEDNK